jgi:hypothetical protein
MMKKVLLGAFCLAISFSLVGCGSQPFTKDQEKVFMEEYMTLATTPSEPDVLEKKMKGNLDRLSKEEASNAIDGMLYAMYQKLPALGKKADGMQESITKEKENNIDINNPESTKKINDQTLKAFVGEVLNDHYYFVEENGRYVVQPNMTYMLEKYEKYMTDSLKATVIFSREEFDVPFYNADTTKFDLDKVVNRIVLLEDNLKKYGDSYYKESFLKSKEYYYQIYFGMNNDLLVDSKKVFLPEVMDHYKKTEKEYPDTQLSKDLIRFLAKLKGTKNVLTDDLQVFLTEMTNVETIDVAEEVVSPTNKKSKQEVKEAIQDAIKENK